MRLYSSLAGQGDDVPVNFKTLGSTGEFTALSFGVEMTVILDGPWPMRVDWLRNLSRLAQQAATELVMKHRGMNPDRPFDEPKRDDSLFGFAAGLVRAQASIYPPREPHREEFDRPDEWADIEADNSGSNIHDDEVRP